MDHRVDLSDDEMHAWRAFFRMQELLRARIERQLIADSGLSNADYTVLTVLSEAPGNRMRQHEIGETLEWEKSRTAHQLARMCGRDLIMRECDPQFPRSMYAVLTATGRDAIDSARPAHAREVRRLFVDQLSAVQLRQMASISDRLLQSLLPAVRTP